MSDQARKAFIALIKETIPGAKVGTIKSVSEQEYTCVVSPVDGGPDYEDVRLRVVIDATDPGIVCIPADDSWVLIAPLFNNPDVYYVNHATHITKWALKVDGGGTFEIDNQGNVVVNGGQLGGLLKLAATVDHLNKIEQKVNAIIDTIKAVWIPASGDGGAALKALFANIQALGVTTADQVENTKFKQ
jgi:hypothetical protein